MRRPVVDMICAHVLIPSLVADGDVLGFSGVSPTAGDVPSAGWGHQGTHGEYE